MNKKSLTSKLINAPYLLWSVLFILAPMVMVVYYAFTDRSGNFTWDNITALTAYKETFGRSIWYAVLATAICLLLSYPLAYIMSRSGVSKQRTLMMLIMLPMWMNFLIRTYSWITILANTGILNSIFKAIGIGQVQMINTPGAVILGMVYNFLPYMVLPIYSVMSKLDYSLVEAAQDLGCNNRAVLRKVIFPMSVAGVISGITMVFVPCITTFVIPQLLNNKVWTIGSLIEFQINGNANSSGGVNNMAAAISFILMIIVFICMSIFSRFDNDGAENGGLL